MWIDAQLWSFLLAITLLSITPGVDTLLVIRNASRGGVREGVITSLAICSGLFVHACVSALGISLILLNSAWAFELLKLLGAAYLIWLGGQSLMSAGRKTGLPIGSVIDDGKEMQRSLWLPLREGFLSNVLNPKTIVFYMAFLPQFIAPSDPPLLKSLWLASLHFLIANVWQIAIVLMIGRARKWLAQGWVASGLNALTGAVLVGFGLKLAFEQRPV